MSNYNNNSDLKVRKGQAYNLAVATAIADGKQHDSSYITKQFLRHLQFAQLLQKATPEQMAVAIENEEILAKLKAIDDEISK